MKRRNPLVESTRPLSIAECVPSAAELRQMDAEARRLARSPRYRHLFDQTPEPTDPRSPRGGR